MKKVNIRLATINDVEIISLLARITFTETFGHLFRDHNDLLSYYEQTFSIPKLRESIKNTNNIFWLALVDELPVGYAKLKIDSPSPFIKLDKISQLQKIYVLKDFLSMKIGSQLQNILIEKATLLESKSIWLSVLNSNERAIRFYKKSSYTNVGDHDFSIGKEDFEFLVFAKEL